MSLVLFISNLNILDESQSKKFPFCTEMKIKGPISTVCNAQSLNCPLDIIMTSLSYDKH